MSKTTEEFIKDADKVHGNKYDYSKVNYINAHTKVIIICGEHGEFEQKAVCHLNGYGCAKCGGTQKLTTEEFIEKVKDIHGDKYDYSEVEYKNTKTKITIICPKENHGKFEQIPQAHKRGNGCPKCSKENMKNKRKTTEQFIKEAINVHGNKYDYSKTIYKGCYENIDIICKTHGIFTKRTDKHLIGQGCQKCGKISKYIKRNEQITINKKTTKEFICEAIKVHGDKYDYSKVEYINNRTKITIICPEHGEIEQVPTNHLRSCGCTLCGTTLTTKTFIKKAIKIYGDIYNYSKVEYKDSHSKIIIICKKHGEFEQSPNGHLAGAGCTKCGYEKLNNIFKLSNKEFIEKAKKVHGDKYDYSKVEYKNGKTKITIICANHGEFKQTPQKHLNDGNGCSKCSEKYNYTTEEWINKSKEIYGDKYDYSKVEYINANTKIIIICKKHGDFNTIPRNFLKGISLCQKCNLCPKCQLWRTFGKDCEYCKPKNKNKLYQKTKEYAIVKYLKENLPDYDLIHNKSVGSDCTKDEKENSNGHLYPDIRFDCDFYHLIVEVDEFKHRGASYKCEKQRMYNIIAKLGLPCIFIRYNPDSKESNKEILLKKVKKYLELNIEDYNVWNDNGFKVKYLFY
jgi:formate dehydrogenase assembly factor FdhD